MSALPSASADPQTQTAAPTEEHQLHRQLRVADLVLAQILCVVGSSWVGVAAGLGPSQTVMWIAAMLAFYLPMAAAVIWLNSAMPLEGGLYIWAHKAFGNLGGFLTAWNLWIYSIAVTATILYSTPTEISYLIGPSAKWLPESPAASFAIVAGLLVVLTVAAIRGLEVGKWIHNIGGAAILAVFAALIFLPLWAIWRGHITHYAGLTVATPQVDLRSIAQFGQMLFGALCGLEYIAIFAGESKHPGRSIAQSVWISSPVICAMFILGTCSVATFVQPGHIDYIAPIPQVLRIALGNTGIGNLLAITAILLLELRLLGAASYLFTGATRLPMAVGWDTLVPAWFTRLSPRWKTPVNSTLCATALVLVLVVMATSGVHAQEAFQLLTNAGLTHYELTYLAMFAAPIAGVTALRRQFSPWLKAVCVVGFLATLFSLLISIFPYVKVVNPAIYAGKIIATVLVSNSAAICFYLWRKRTWRRDAGMELNTRLE
ncbi:APC family permease [Acidicapsa dinghuensis]|uniref:APC family permease n=1 Tax=Acidicapsa dinghuensis TaxID=2218256 RepID=A0ABW1EJ69_9BACT|nr:APC family permease [Acidicapsa dinghuensis]